MNKQLSISEDTNCPICFEMPKIEVFQCVNGHTICGECLERVSKCPQCAVPYDGVKIRNRALESILDKMSLDCAHLSKGCKSTLTRNDLQAHNKNCSFGGVELKLCEYVGYKCGFVINTNQMEKARAHLLESHNSPVIPATKMCIYLSDISENGAPKINRFIWRPYIFDFHGHSFLVFFIHNPEKEHVSMHFLKASGDMSESVVGNDYKFFYYKDHGLQMLILQMQICQRIERITMEISWRVFHQIGELREVPRLVLECGTDTHPASVDNHRESDYSVPRTTLEVLQFVIYKANDGTIDIHFSIFKAGRD